jgi:hypothetical protein
VAEAISAKSYVSTGKVFLDVVIILDRTPVVRRPVVKHKLKREKWFLILCQ